MTHTIGMISLGCAKNQVNAEHMLWLLRQAGYADFIEVLVDLEVDRSEEYYSLLRKNGMLFGSMTRQLHHMITRAYFTAVCETIVHDMPREEAMKYVDELAIFFHSGWSGLLRLE